MSDELVGANRAPARGGVSGSPSVSLGGDAVVTEFMAPDLTREGTVTSSRLKPLLVTCLISFAAWELARQVLARAPEGWAPPMVWSLVRALLLLVPAVLVTRRVFDEGPVRGLWLGPPERQGLLRSCLIGGGFVIATQGLNVALGNPFVLPSPDAATLARALFDAAVEEALFRGFVLSHLLPGRRFARANLLAALIFLLPHTRKVMGLWGDAPGIEVAIMPLAIFILGLVLGATARPIRSIWIGSLVHAIGNLFS